MFKLRFGYLLVGIATGLILILNFLWTLPDGKLHIVFCNVGQGDAAYIRFPDGRDMLVDGGPNDMVLQCLSKYMPFWDRTLDIVVLSHPEKDHMQGLISVFDRYHIGYFIHSDVAKGTDVDARLFALVKAKKIPDKLVTTGEHISVGPVKLAVVWPSADQIADFKRSHLAVQGLTLHGSSVLGAATTSVNKECVVFWLRYGSFDALFTGDADTQVESNYTGTQLADITVEVLKVPHHGSKTGMNAAFLDWLYPISLARRDLARLAIISVGKNTYGHPAPETLQMLADYHVRVLRTDQKGDIEIVSDGKGWGALSR